MDFYGYSLGRNPYRRGYIKINPEELKAYAAEHPDAYLKEIGEAFGCSATAVYKALKKLGITRKKGETVLSARP